jgi:hypothetical protein
MKPLAIALVAVLALNVPVAAMAQRGGGDRGGGGGRPSFGGGGGGRPGGGFSFPNDTRPAQPAPRPPTAQRPPTQPQRPPNNGGNNGYRPPNNGGNNGYRPPNNGNVGYRPPNNIYRPPNYNGGGRTVVVAPYRPVGPAWGWNHGVVWAPAPYYWGGGFWGSLAIGVTSAAVFGAIVSANNEKVTSYQVQPNSPGATLLQNYQLQQVQCGPPGLVVIFGPNNSVICANPNNLVAPGNYGLDATQLTLVSQ